MRVSVLGCGRWGSFIAWYLAGIGHTVTLYGRPNSERLKRIKQTGGNEYVTFSGNVEFTDDLSHAMSACETAVISVSSAGLRRFTREIISSGGADKVFVLCMKGLESETGKRLSEIVIEEGVSKEKVAVWVGPGHIQEFAQGKPNCMVIDGYDKSLVKSLADEWRSDLIRFYYGDDIIGSEIGAAAKNVFGIAAGMLDGGGYTTLKGSLMARGAREVSRLIKAMGGNELSAYGLCHLGDYETTLFSEFSNNRRFGTAYVQGTPFDKLAEGVYAAKGLKILGEKYGEELPITNAVYSIIYGQNDPMKVLLNLFSRSTRPEF